MIEKKENTEANSTELKDLDIPSAKKIDFNLDPDLFSEEFWNNVKTIFNIISKYRNSEYIYEAASAIIQGDLLSLQSHLAFIAYEASHIIGYSSIAEDHIKTERAKIRLLAKSTKSDKKFTSDDLTAFTYSKTEDIFLEYRKYTAAAEFLKYCNYTVRDFINILENAMKRMTAFDPKQS